MRDFNNDGILDFAVAGSSGLSILLGNGDGTFKTAYHYSAAPEAFSVVVGEFNSDGIADLAVLFNGGVRVFLGKGDGSFQTPPISYLAGTGSSAVTVGDFNGDGLLDLAVANATSNDVSILFNDGQW